MFKSPLAKFPCAGAEVRKDAVICTPGRMKKPMTPKQALSMEDICRKGLKTKATAADEYGLAALTHYLHNRDQGISRFYKAEAVAHVKRALALKYPEVAVTSRAAEEALETLCCGAKEDLPFPAPKNPKFTFIDLFAGIGGFRTAMQNLGGKCVFTSGWDDRAKQTYRANFGEVPFGDITKEETKGFIPDGFDLLCAGFPCQAFSIAGRRGGFEDTRGTLFFDVAEIIRRKQPKALFLENVKGLFNHDRGKTLKTILNVLRNDLGYFIPDPKILNAKHFGVPQNRERVFIVGFRGDLGIGHFDYPEPSNEAVTFEEVKEEEAVSVKYYLSAQYLSTLEKHRQRHESKGNGFGYEIIPDDGTANAVVCGGMGRERNLVYDDRLEDFTPVTKIKGPVNRQGIRKMTPREWARLQGFPDAFLIPVADASAYRQFGNSVAVPAVQATAREILKKLISEGPADK